MKNNQKLLVLAFLLLGVLLNATNSVAENKGNITDTKMKLHMVLFTPADKDFPEGYRDRYKEIADYAESFFVKWMNYWGYPCENPLKIERDANGYPTILKIKGKYNYDDPSYKKLAGIKKEVIEQAKNKFNIDTKNQVWWILNYPNRKRSSRGGGNVQEGGTCFANYHDGQGNIKVTDELGAGLAEKIKLKSIIHELTHALGLGHVGPNESLDLGNTLMGPVNKSYKKFFKDDSRVYLSKAGATILWKHPLFCGGEDDRMVTPSVKLNKYSIKYDSKNNSFIVEGKLKSNCSAHSVVISNASKAERSPYWYKAFVGKVRSNGSFRCVVSNLKKADGQLVIGFSFNNGVITGDGKKLGLNKSGIKKQYRFCEGKYLFD